MVTTFYPPYNFGGDGIFVERLVLELAERGHHVEVIHCVDSYRVGGGPEPTRGYAEHENVVVHGLRSRFGALSPLVTQQLGVPGLKRRAIRDVLGRGFDVINYHNASLVGGPGVLAYGDAIKLYTMHEYWLVCPTHVLFRYEREACTRPTCLRCQLVHRRPPQLWRYTGAIARGVRHVDAFIAPSRFSADRHAGLGARIEYLPNFAPPMPEHATDATTDPHPEGPYFLAVGRLEKLKGLQDVIPLFKRFDRATLLIAGDGDYRGTLEALADGSPRVRFLGRKTSDELTALFRHAVAVIMPSICYENFPLVTIEAFQQRTPVIVRDLGGMPEVVRNSDGGLTFSDEAELARAMTTLLDDRALRDRLGENGHRTYREQWTADVYLERYLGLIDELEVRRR